MRIGHFEICILKLIKKISRKVMDQLNWNFVYFRFPKSNIYNIKINKAIPKFNENSVPVSLNKKLHKIKNERKRKID